MKLSFLDLGKIYSLAKQNYVDNAIGNTHDEQNFITVCWIKAIETTIGLKQPVELPRREFPDVED